MANVIKPRRTTTASKVPTTGDLADGELGVNVADKLLYIRNGASVVPIANFATPYTDANAQAAVVIDSIADADTTHAPSSNAVFDALALKEASFTKGGFIAGANVTLDGTLPGRLVGSGNITINATAAGAAANLSAVMARISLGF